ncbi:hypothetical protein GF357_03915 [Candidatus Dojkabacteria bacterium]|nr:hypothetical protein [Candidatus Dojkabacteria bacterium]
MLHERFPFPIEETPGQRDTCARDIIYALYFAGKVDQKTGRFSDENVFRDFQSLMNGEKSFCNFLVVSIDSVGEVLIKLAFEARSLNLDSVKNVEDIEQIDFLIALNEFSQYLSESLQANFANAELILTYFDTVVEILEFDERQMNSDVRVYRRALLDQIQDEMRYDTIFSPNADLSEPVAHSEMPEAQTFSAN